MEGSKNSS